MERTSISTILDLIRFLAEPDSIRFSHITMRGPYSSAMNKGRLEQLNSSCIDRRINLVRPEKFFSERQSSVVIAIDLLALENLVHKPDFPDGTPHLTLYDGKDRLFAEELYGVASQYRWENQLVVGPLQEITAKKPVDQEFLPFFTSFYAYFRGLVADPVQIPAVRTWSYQVRLGVIRAIFEKCTIGDVFSEDRKKFVVSPHSLATAI